MSFLYLPLLWQALDSLETGASMSSFGRHQCDGVGKARVQPTQSYRIGAITFRSNDVIFSQFQFTDFAASHGIRGWCEPASEHRVASAHHLNQARSLVQSLHLNYIHLLTTSQSSSQSLTSYFTLLTGKHCPPTIGSSILYGDTRL